ncbi:hypothetical protein PILCRDRAFT_2083 [Piloderma croceum F 1598]|uniref:DUF6589 domain-containing protein n=1 Tax=Piloderma croceum (strain F 1598) TaxID=765440 RepID=A0A0C3CJ99_PILCF|nr:hypothetical protein PILCRDRAFT_2083 [Piloderma croceum F 1598]
MHVDESSLEGTLKVLNTIFCDTLKMSAEDLQKHGLVFCTGDQLTISLLDKASASRRDDSELLDNVGCYTKGQLGLFHMKITGDQAVNSLLGRKAIAAGWKSKTLPPFHPTWELILKMALPAHIIDAYRLHCLQDTVENWVVGLKDREEVHQAAKKIHVELCSPRCVSRMRRFPLPQWDVPLENIMLFLYYALLLRKFGHAIKHGDVGSVVNILAHWMVIFCGTGKMPKYADALFYLLVSLNDAFLKNWLANLTGKVNGFKEMDLLQEHQNFWAKIIYCAGGSNRSWSWLTMVTVSIFTLRDVICRVQVQYQTPHNNDSHMSPSTVEDLKDLREYLEMQKLQSFHPTCEHNKYAIPARDLMAAGAAYANKSGAYKNFQCDTRKAVNKGVSEGAPRAAMPESEDEPDMSYHDLSNDAEVGMNDLAMDEEEFPLGTNPERYVAMTLEVIEELSKYD